jgi:hypothetical protein
MFIRHYTKSFDDTAARIKKLVDVLDRSWYQAKKKEFEKLCNDGEDYYEIETPSETQVVTFDIFCFNTDYSLGVTGKATADKIIATTGEIINDVGDDKDYEAFKSWVDDVKAWTEEAVNDKINFYKSEEYASVMYSIVHKIKWEIDYCFNDKLKTLERKYTRNMAAVSVGTGEATPINITHSDFSAGYETESLKDIFFLKAIEKYTDIEKRLLADEFIDANCVWLRQKKELVALIHILNNRKYFRPISGKSKSNYYKYYKYFFENRYNIDISEQSKPSKFPLTNLRHFEPIFHFVEYAE